MKTFSEIAEAARARYEVVHEEKFMVGLEVEVGDSGRHQSVFLAELRDSDDRRTLRFETTVGPLDDHDPVRMLRVNLLLRVGYLAVGDLEGVPFLKLCENVAYRHLTEASMVDLVRRIAELGDEIEQGLNRGGDLF